MPTYGSSQMTLLRMVRIGSGTGFKSILRRFRLSPVPATVILIAGLALALGGCSEDGNPLLPYEGDRPLILERVTVSATPDVQWVGGRVAAVGVNVGAQAALDSTLVWMISSDADDIDSAIRIGDLPDPGLIEMHGGQPTDSLADGNEYTFWIAEQSVLENGFPKAGESSGAFADTTISLEYLIRGRPGGTLIDEVRIVRNQTLTSDDFIISWLPADVDIRRLAIRQASIGGFTDLRWDVLVDGQDAEGIQPPVILGQAPEGTQEAVEWPSTGFEPSTYILWMTDPSWQGSFSSRAIGYGFFQIFSNNFD